MSKSSTPSSSSHPSTPSQPSSRGSHSDTTPSPGSTKSARFDPYALSSRLAFLEASESLAQAAETLAVASKAMSKAAASLAMATSGYYRHELDNSAAEAPDQQPPPGWVDTSNWENPLFALPTSLVLPDKTAEQPAETGERSSMPTKDEAPILEDTPTAPQPADISESQTTPTLSQIGQETHSTAFPEPETATHVAPVSTAISPTDPESVEAQEAEWSTAESDITSDSSEDIGEDTPSEEDVEDESDEGGDPEPEVETSSEDEDQDPYELPYHSPGFGSCDKPFTMIVLDRGFDEVPAIAEYASRYAKTICFWKYWGAAMSLGSALRSITSKDTIIPDSLKPNKLKEAANTFTKPSYKGILIWPAEHSFWEAADWNHSPKILLIHAGYPLENANLETNRRVVIMAQSEWKDLDSNQTRYIRKNSYLDIVNSDYNQKGDDTDLDSGRELMRTHFGKPSAARAFYAAWITYHREENPGWSTKHLVVQANRYAREYLLRGGNGGKKWVGDPVSLSMGQIQAMNLGPAVEAGVLPVA